MYGKCKRIMFCKLYCLIMNESSSSETNVPGRNCHKQNLLNILTYSFLNNCKYLYPDHGTRKSKFPWIRQKRPAKNSTYCIKSQLYKPGWWNCLVFSDMVNCNWNKCTFLCTAKSRFPQLFRLYIKVREMEGHINGPLDHW